MIKWSGEWNILIILTEGCSVFKYLFGSFSLFYIFSCLPYFLGNKSDLVLQTFDEIFACNIRLLHCKVLLYCIFKGCEAIVVSPGHSDSLVFLLTHYLSTKVESASKRSFPPF